MAGEVRACTALSHDKLSELWALHQLQPSVFVVLRHLGQVACRDTTARDSHLSGVIVVGAPDEATPSRDAHWEVGVKVLIESAVLLGGLGWVLELGVTRDLGSSEECLINITVRIWIYIVLCVVKERVGVISVASRLFRVRCMFRRVKSLPLDRI